MKLCLNLALTLSHWRHAVAMVAIITAALIRHTPAVDSTTLTYTSYTVTQRQIYNLLTYVWQFFRSMH